MTERGLWGRHRHRLLWAREGGLVHRVLTHQWVHTYSAERAASSLFVWGPCRRSALNPEHQCYGLSLLGVAHALTGLTLAVRTDVGCGLRMRPGWRCTRPWHLDGPCAPVPRRWNLVARWRSRG